MAINIQIQDNCARITMSGRFDFQVHRDFKDAYTPLLDNAAAHVIEIELGKVGYMDSSALGMLMLLHERAKAVNKSISLLNPSDVVSKLLEVANFGRNFDIGQAS